MNKLKRIIGKLRIYLSLPFFFIGYLLTPKNVKEAIKEVIQEGKQETERMKQELENKSVPRIKNKSRKLH